MCLDTLGKDEKTVFPVGIFNCQSGGSASQVCPQKVKTIVQCPPCLSEQSLNVLQTPKPVMLCVDVDA